MPRQKKVAAEDVDDSVEDLETTGGGGGGGGGGTKGRKRASSGKGGGKKAKRPPSEESDPEEEEEDYADEDEDEEKEDSVLMKDVPKYFHSGNFVLKKADVKWEGDSVITDLKDLNIWKIDGKSLLQKYAPLESDGKVLHKCTCAYSGWDVESRENFYPISEILDMNPKTDSKEVCVAFNLEDLIKVKDK